MTMHQISDCGVSEQDYKHTCLSTLAFISSFLLESFIYFIIK